MKNQINGLLIAFVLFFCANFVFAQQGFYVDKDERIEQCQKAMIKLLVKENQLESLGTDIKVKDYVGKMYVKKHLEFYKEHLLLVEFGSLADHANQYWSILNNKGRMYIIDNRTIGNDTIKGCFDENIAQTVLCFMSNYH